MIVGESEDAERRGLGLHVSLNASDRTVVLLLRGVRKSFMLIKKLMINNKYS